jgi:hypothetical protein
MVTSRRLLNYRLISFKGFAQKLISNDAWRTLVVAERETGSQFRDQCLD